jgi:hypothetical protein
VDKVNAVIQRLWRTKVARKRTLSGTLLRKGITRAFQRLSESDADYWTYKRMAQRKGLHGMIRYPAMMVPQMQSDVLAAVRETLPSLKEVVDPFVGSGTTMVECLRQRLSFEGIDINPLAVLICRAKLLAIEPQALWHRASCLAERLDSDRSSAISAGFSRDEKWFTRRAIVELSRVQRAIASEAHKQTRQFFWVVLCETVRQTSLSRETTYKLHIRATHDQERLAGPLRRFFTLLMDACLRYEHHWETYRSPTGCSLSVTLRCADVRAVQRRGLPRAQLLLTSPPYGDNESTIAYGQFSYLPLRWIPSSDLEGEQGLRLSAYATDTASLGGSVRGSVDRAVAVAAVLPSFRRFMDKLTTLDRPELLAKASAFTADFFQAVGASLSCLQTGGLAVWTLGERTVGGLRVPLVEICREANEFFGMEPVTEIARRIQGKRTPHANSMGPTIASESLVVMTKP